MAIISKCRVQAEAGALELQLSSDSKTPAVIIVTGHLLQRRHHTTTTVAAALPLSSSTSHRSH